MFQPQTRILILDDMLTIRKIVSKSLRDMGFTNVVEAADGQEGWVKMTEAVFPYELVISDWNMPNMPGIELLKKARSDERYAKVPFILLTAEAEAQQITEAIQLGVSNYIIKPFTVETLRQKLEQTYKKISA